MDWGKFDPFRRFHRNFILNKMVHQNKIRELFKSIIPNQFCIKMAKICTSGQFTSFRFTKTIPITFTKNPTELLRSTRIKLLKRCAARPNANELFRHYNLEACTDIGKLIRYIGCHSLWLPYDPIDLGGSSHQA